jgi:hypothetical protein
MDFIVGLPKAGSKSVIMVVVDCLSKYAHFCHLLHHFTPTLIAQVFLDHIFKLHGMPTSIVSDHDPNFTSIFWQEFFKLQGTQLNMRKTCHPHSNNQTKVVNNFLENLLALFFFRQETPVGVVASLGRMVVQYFLSYDH